jgi:hypothetical protein
MSEVASLEHVPGQVGTAVLDPSNGKIVEVRVASCRACAPYTAVPQYRARMKQLIYVRSVQSDKLM